MTQTNETTTLILDFLLHRKILAWRQNVLPIPITRQGQLVGYRPGSKAGLPDILAILPPSGRTLLIEVKTGKDQLRPVQIAFLEQSRSCGAMVLMVKDYDDLLAQFKKGS